ncbi:1585_t:CDS:2, partial [Diversispora eburnea]
NFCQKEYPFDNVTYEQFNNDILQFWQYCVQDLRELGAVALKLFGICNNKVLAMSQLRASINYSMCTKKLKQIENIFNEIHEQQLELEPDPLLSQASPIDIDKSNNFDLDNIEDSQIEEVTFEMETDPTQEDILTVEKWEEQLCEWEESLIEEETAYQEEEEANRGNSENLDNLLDEYIHPAVDPSAKWNLTTLFNSLFSAPDYLLE